MRHAIALGTVVVTTCVLGAVLLAALPVPVVAQNLGGLRVEDEDMGRKLRHPNAYREDLMAPRSFRAGSAGPRYTYRFYDYPKPSFQFFQQGQTYKWSWDLFPGGEARIYSARRPRGYYGPTYNTYNYYPDYYYYPPAYPSWGW